MGRNSICVIYDSDENYAKRLMSVINDDNDIPYNAQVFTQEQELDKYLQEKKADMLMICEGAYEYDATRTGNKTVVLCEEEQDADDGSKSHVGKYFWDGDEHKRRSGLQSVWITTGESENCRDNHKTCHNGNGSIKNFYILCGVFNRSLFFHIRTKGDQNTHGNGQGIEHLSHGGHYSHPGKICHIRYQKIFHTGHGARSGDRINSNDNG